MLHAFDCALQRFVLVRNRFHLNVENTARICFGFTLSRYDWLKKPAPHFHPIRSKNKTNRDLLAQIFPRFLLASCIS